MPRTSPIATPQLKAEPRTELAQETRPARSRRRPVAFFAAEPGEQAQWKFDAALDRCARPPTRTPCARPPGRRMPAAPIHDEMKKDFDRQPGACKRSTSARTRSSNVGRTPEERLAAVHRHARRRRRAQGGQRQPMEAHAEVLQRPACRRRLQVPGPAGPNDTWNGFYDEYVPPLVMQSDPPVRAASATSIPTRCS